MVSCFAFWHTHPRSRCSLVKTHPSLLCILLLIVDRMGPAQRVPGDRMNQRLVLVNKQINRKHNHHHHSSYDHHNYRADTSGNQNADSRVIEFDRIYFSFILSIVCVHHNKLLYLVRYWLHFIDNEWQTLANDMFSKTDWVVFGRKNGRYNYKNFVREYYI